MATFFEPKVPIPIPSGKELKSKWGTALSQSPFVLPESGLGEEGIKINPELISAFLETLNLIDQGGMPWFAQPVAFNVIPKSIQWSKAARKAAEEANRQVMGKSATLGKFSDAPLFLQPRGSLGKDTVARTLEGAIDVPYQYGFDNPQMRWAGKVIATPEEYLESIFAHEGIHLAGQKGGSTIRALESAAAERPDLFKLFSGSESYKNPATWAPEYVARAGQQVAVPSLPVARLTHPVDKEWLELMSSYLKNPNLTVKDMERIAPSLAKAFQPKPYFTSPYTEAAQLATKEKPLTKMDKIFQTIKEDIAWGSETHPIRGTVELEQSPFARQRFQNEIINRLKGLMEDPFGGVSKKDTITDLKRVIEHTAKIDTKAPGSAANLEIVAQSLHGMYHRRAGTAMTEARKILGNDKNADKIIRGMVDKAYASSPYPGVGKYSTEEIKKSWKEGVEKSIPKPGSGSKTGRGLTEGAAPKTSRDGIGNKWVKTFLDDGSTAILDLSDPKWPQEVERLNKLLKK